MTLARPLTSSIRRVSRELARAGEVHSESLARPLLTSTAKSLPRSLWISPDLASLGLARRREMSKSRETSLKFYREISHELSRASCRGTCVHKFDSEDTLYKYIRDRYVKNRLTLTLTLSVALDPVRRLARVCVPPLATSRESS